MLDTDRSGDLLRLHLQGGEVIDSKAVVIATGARYRALPLERWPDFEGAGICYAATELEARECTGSPVTVVGGANSAGQAALYLAGRGSEVSLVVRGPRYTRPSPRWPSDQAMRVDLCGFRAFADLLAKASTARRSRLACISAEHPVAPLRGQGMMPSWIS